jgi:tripartite-type tricarboxylate transporter receptor subunit TctC
MKDLLKKVGKSVVLLSLVSLVFVFPGAGIAAEKKFPAEPVRIIVGFKVGGLTDVRARMIQPFLQEALGVPVVVENMDGSGGGIAANFVKKQKSDGYTLMVVQMPNAVALRHTMGQKFDYIKDFKPIYEFSNKDFNFFSVRPDSAIQTIDDLVKATRERKVTVALAGYGSNSHVTVAMFSELVKPKNLVIVPCASSSESMTQVVGGHVDFCITATGGAVFKMVEEGKVRALAIAADSRLASMPQLPTFKEKGYNLSMEGSFGVVAPAGVPNEVVKIIEAAFDKATKNEKFIDTCQKQGVVSSQIGSEEFTKRTAYWQELVDSVAGPLKETMDKQ